MAEASEIAEAHRMFAAGKSASEIARTLGRARSTIMEWRQKWKAVSSTDVQDMKAAAERSAVRLPVEGYDEEPFPAADVWKRHEVENAKRIERALAQSKFRLQLPGDRPAAICFISDQHISGGNVVDLKRMREDAEFIARSPDVYAVLGGDGVDNHIKHRAAVLAARTQPDD